MPDPVWIGRVQFGFEPDASFGLLLPEPIEELTDGHHPEILPRLHLWPRPVDGEDRRLSLVEPGEDPVIDVAIPSKEVVVFDVGGQRRVPCFSSLSLEGPLDDGAAASADRID